MPQRTRNPYSLTTPCDSCPFRTDVTPFIKPGRVQEIAKSLVRHGFPCHQTVDYDTRDHRKEIQCAGALIVLEKMRQPSQLMRISERIGLYDVAKLKMDAPVYGSLNEMLDAHVKAEEDRRSRRSSP